jgi:hypothetical protein
MNYYFLIFFHLKVYQRAPGALQTGTHMCIVEIFNSQGKRVVESKCAGNRAAIIHPTDVICLMTWKQIGPDMNFQISEFLDQPFQIIEFEHGA